MKKLMFAAAALAAGIAMADVSSANVVGYHSITVYPGWNVISVNMENMTDNDGYTMDQIFPGNTPGLVAHRQQLSADYIQIWDNAEGGYVSTLYYLYVTKNADDPTVDYTWRKSKSVPCDVKLKSGDAIWYFHQGDPEKDPPITVTCAGSVKMTATPPEVTIYPGWNMIGAPYAAGLNFGACGSEYWKNSGAVAHRQQLSADYIQIWDNAEGAYVSTLYYLYVTKNADDPTVDYTWRKSKSAAMPADTLKIGCGVWYFHQGEAGDAPITLKLTPPYSL